MQEIFHGVFRKDNSLLTPNAARGERVYGEKLVVAGGVEYRMWDPCRSKPAAAILKGLKIFPVGFNSKVLYLGAAQGTTVSHFSDIVGKNGIIYAVEISDRAIRELLPLAERRGNIVPIAADARMPERYSWVEPVDVVYEDVADPEQAEIIIRNAGKFLKNRGHAMLAVKARSIDVTKAPDKIFKQQASKLEKFFEILQVVPLEPYEKDHCMIVMRKK